MAKDISEFYKPPYNGEFEFYKEHKGDKMWHFHQEAMDGFPEITFDKKKIYNIGADFPYNMTQEEIAIFKRECPYWYNFFAWRCK